MYHGEGRPAEPGRPLPPHATVAIDLTPGLVVRGDNDLTLTLLFSGMVDAGAVPDPEPIVVDEMDVTIVPANHPPTTPTPPLAAADPPAGAHSPA